MQSNLEKTVAVVDDDESMRLYLGETLTSGGYNCRMFPDAASLLGWLASGEERVDLLLSDINMPGMNGLDLLRTVRAVVPDLPFVLISGKRELPIVRNAVLAGANDYLLKPVGPAELLGVVSKHLDSLDSETLAATNEALKRYSERARRRARPRVAQ